MTFSHHILCPRNKGITKFCNTLPLSYFSVFKAIAISRWFTETWPLGVDGARQGRAGEGELQRSSVVKNTKMVLAANPSVLQSTRGEAGVFSEYKSRTLGQVLKKKFEQATSGKTPTLQSTQESKAGVFENQRREICLNTKLTFSGNWNENAIFSLLISTSGKKSKVTTYFWSPAQHRHLC